MHAVFYFVCMGGFHWKAYIENNENLGYTQQMKGFTNPVGFFHFNWFIFRDNKLFFIISPTKILQNQISAMKEGGDDKEKGRQLPKRQWSLTSGRNSFLDGFYPHLCLHSFNHSVRLTQPSLTFRILFFTRPLWRFSPPCKSSSASPSSSSLLLVCADSIFYVKRYLTNL